MAGIQLRNDWAYYALFKYFWIIAILPKALQLVGLGALLCLMFFRCGREKSLDNFSIMQLLFLLIYSAAIVVNALDGTHESDRIFAAVNTWAITLIAVFLYHLYRGWAMDLHRLGRYCFFNLVVLSVLWVVFMLTEGIYPVMGKVLSGADWVNGDYTPRFLGYLDYGNLVVFAVLFFYPAAMRFLEKKWWIGGALTVVLFFVVYSTNSRSGLVLYALVFLAWVLFESQERFFRTYRLIKPVLLFTVLLAVGVVLTLGLTQVQALITEIVEMRKGSNNMRFFIYNTSLQTMWENSPVIGIGIKDMVGNYPLGSHSTYIGVLYKAGILGGIIYIISMLYVAIRYIFGKDRDRNTVTLKICVIAVLVMMALEDIDGANWCVCIFYSLLGLLEGTRNDQPTKERRISL